MIRRPVAYWTTLFLLCTSLLLTGGLTGCDLLDSGNEAPFDVPPERLVALTAVYEETVESGRPVQRLVVADVQNPSNYDVLSKAGTSASRPCFGPDKRKLLFEDHSESTIGSRAAIKLLDLETRKVRPLDATGSLKGCVWRADGSGFYYAAALGAGLRRAAVYDLASGEKRAFAQTERQSASFPYGRKGRDSILVLAGDTSPAGLGYYFVDAETSTYLAKVENEHLQFVPWEDPDQGGWKRGAFRPAYNDEWNQITFLIGGVGIRENIAVTSLDGSLFELYGASGDLAPLWGPSGTILFERREIGIMILNLRTDDVRTLVKPSVIDGAVGLRTPDY